MRTELIINGIERETEKAILVSANVYFNANAEKARTFWMPKSLLEVVREDLIVVEDWLLNKLSRENAFRGYEMRFAGLMSNYINA